MSAMMRKARKSLKKEEIQGMMGSEFLIISYRGGTDVYKIKLKQKMRLIEPKKMIKPEMGNKDPEEHAVFIAASFPYSQLDLNAKTTIMVVKDFGTDKYEVDFSQIK